MLILLRSTLFYFATFGLIPSCFSSNIDALPTSFKNSLNKSQIPYSAMSLHVIKIKNPSNNDIGFTEILGWRSDAPMNPASTMKVLTTVGALNILGPHYQWQLKIFTDGSIDQGVLNGNLYLQGFGDPKFSQDDLERIALELRAMGIDKINGKLIFDRSAHDPSLLSGKTLDGQVNRSYNVFPDPLLYSLNTLKFQIGAVIEGGTPSITYQPNLANFKVVNNLKQNRNTSCGNWQELIGFHISNDEKNAPQTDEPILATFNGSIPLGCDELTYPIVALPPNTMLTRGFQAVWESAGGEWAAAPAGENGTVPESANQLISHQGTLLKDAIWDINNFSNNTMAKQVFLTIGLDKTGKPASLDKSALAIKQWLSSNNLIFPELSLENGSGLSRVEAISARNLTTVLTLLQSPEASAIFLNSLPVPGKDGTMKNRLNAYLTKYDRFQSKPEAHIKTGSLSDVKAISGFVKSRSGNLYAISSFINHENANKGQDAHDQLLIWLIEDGPEKNRIKP